MLHCSRACNKDKCSIERNEQTVELKAKESFLCVIDRCHFFGYASFDGEFVGPIISISLRAAIFLVGFLSLPRC